MTRRSPRPGHRSTRIGARSQDTKFRRTTQRAKSSNSLAQRPKIDFFTGAASLVAAIASIGALVVSFHATSTNTQQAYAGIYDNASQRIGNESTMQRFAAIYAFEHLMRQAPDYQPAIIDVLSAFVRTSTNPSNTPPDHCSSAKLSPDAQAAIGVLGRRDPIADGRSLVNFEGSCLQRVHLEHYNLDNANLSQCNLRAANIKRAKLNGAKFDESILTDVRYDTQTELRSASHTKAIGAWW